MHSMLPGKYPEVLMSSAGTAAYGFLLSHFPCGSAIAAAAALTPRDNGHSAQLQRWLQDANLELASLRKRHSEQVHSRSLASLTWKILAVNINSEMEQSGSSRKQRSPPCDRGYNAGALGVDMRECSC